MPAMTQPNILELAKQGDANAIAYVINHLLKDKGITVKALFKGSCLLVLLESFQVPDQQSSVVSIRTVMRQLEVKSIKSVRIYGKLMGQNSAVWKKFLDLTPQADSASTESPSLTYKDEVKEPKQQASSLESPQSGHRSKTARWPALFPEPSSWFRPLIIVPIAFLGAILIVFGFSGVLLSLIKNNPLTITSQTLSPEASTPADVTPIPVTSQTPSSQSDPFRLAVNKAMSAANLTQSAKSKQDWNLVANQWQEAIALMKTIPASSPNYAVAQKKVGEYQKNLDYASSAASRSK